AVISRALAKKVEDRFATIAAFADAFEQAVQQGDDYHPALVMSQENNALFHSNRTEEDAPTFLSKRNEKNIRQGKIFLSRGREILLVSVVLLLIVAVA